MSPETQGLNPGSVADPSHGLHSFQPEFVQSEAVAEYLPVQGVSLRFAVPYSAHVRAQRGPVTCA